MGYTFRLPPQDPKALPEYLGREFNAIAQAMTGPADVVRLEPQAVAPLKPRDGMVVYADGTNWNPGAGAGVYARVSGAWVKMT